MKSDIMDRYKALNLRQSSNLRLALADAYASNKVLLGAVIGIASVEIAKIVAATHPDWVWIDAEHTPYSPTLLMDMVQILPFEKIPRSLDVYTLRIDSDFENVL